MRPRLTVGARLRRPVRRANFIAMIASVRGVSCCGNLGTYMGGKQFKCPSAFLAHGKVVPLAGPLTEQVEQCVTP